VGIGEAECEKNCEWLCEIATPVSQFSAGYRKIIPRRKSRTFPRAKIERIVPADSRAARMRRIMSDSLSPAQV
jgi:hypothetical protein